MADSILFQDKGVFQSNVYEVIRAHQALCNRFLAAERKLADLNVGDGSDFTALKQQLTDLTAGVKDLTDSQAALKAKVDGLFPDEGATPPPAEDEPTESSSEPPADETDASDTPAI